MTESCFPICQNFQHSKHSQPVRTAFVREDTSSSKPDPAEVTMLVARVASIPSATLAVKLHEAGKEVSDMICMQCCRSCRSTDPTVAVPLCSHPKYDMEASRQISWKHQTCFCWSSKNETRDLSWALRVFTQPKPGDHLLSSE